VGGSPGGLRRPECAAIVVRDPARYAAAVNRRNAGLFLMLISTLLWIAVFVVPFFDGPNDLKVAAAAGLYGVSWVLLAASTWLLGPEAMERMRGYTRGRLTALRNRSR
jgi:hypothetical protein